MSSILMHCVRISVTGTYLCKAMASFGVVSVYLFLGRNDLCSFKSRYLLFANNERLNTTESLGTYISDYIFVN